MLIWLLAFGFTVCAQNAISGYANMGEPDMWEQKVYLSQINTNDGGEQPIASSPIDTNGFFSFKKELLDQKDRIYRLHVNRIGKILNDTVINHKQFILSGRDTIFFKKGAKLFSDYSNTNPTDAEWQRWKKFEAKLSRAKGEGIENNSNQYVGDIKKYVKDSLKILMVKLISIKELENKKLLDRDISENTAYYLSLLDDLKKSDVPSSEYWFLEAKLMEHSQIALEEKYRFSKIMNIVLGVVVLGLTLLFFSLKRKRSGGPLDDLSKQEKNVKNLILRGKSNKEIAKELFISVSTVKTHITHIYNKLNVSNRKELLERHKNQIGTST